MILSISFNGYRFFNNSTLSFVADARTKKLMSNSTEVDGKNVLKTIGIYGSNNSGKTNLVTLMELVKRVLNGKDNIVFNNPIFGDEKIFNFSITFNNLSSIGWLKYEFLYNNEKRQFDEEKLSTIKYYDSGNYLVSTIFERNYKNNILNIFSEDMSKYLPIIPSRLSFFYSVSLEAGDFAVLQDYFIEIQKLANSIEIVKMYDIPFENTLETMKNNDFKKIHFIQEFVKNADVEINNFEYDDSVQLTVSEKINEKALSRLEKVSDSLKLMTTYGDKKVPSLMFDSTGTKKIESIASYIYDALTEGKILIIDEIDNGLHYKLTRSIVSIFNNLVNTKSQLLFITHDLLLIDCNKLMRKDQIYFINRNQKRAELFCLKEATVSDGGPREVNDIVKHYNRGEFGSVPNPDFIDLIVEAILDE